jgi:hypothetical protein
MIVGFHETGKHSGSLQIDAFRFWTAETPQFIVGADCGDPAPCYSHGTVYTSGLIQGVDLSVVENDVHIRSPLVPEFCPKVV